MLTRTIKLKNSSRFLRVGSARKTDSESSVPRPLRNATGILHRDSYQSASCLYRDTRKAHRALYLDCKNTHRASLITASEALSRRGIISLRAFIRSAPFSHFIAGPLGLRERPFRILTTDHKTKKSKSLADAKHMLLSNDITSALLLKAN